MRLVSLEQSSRLCEAADTLTLENERLRAALQDRDDERRRERAAAARAADAARRGLERDLHDGAQQHLVALALDLRVLEARATDTEFAPAIDDLIKRLAGALAELRALVRGVYPAVLTTHGLGPGLRDLAGRAPLPVVVDADAIERMPAHVEATAYFVVAEALTNVARHARASHATVAVEQDDAGLVIDVTDDGGGGADITHGTGLLGLRERLEAIGGTLAVESAPGLGTRLVAGIPHVRS